MAEVTPLQLNIPAEQVEKYVHEALLASLTAEARAKIILDAIKHISTPEEIGHGYRARRVSPLQRAFETAFASEAQRQVHAMISENNEFRQAIVEVVRAGVEKWMTSSRDDITDKIAAHISLALTERDR